MLQTRSLTLSLRATLLASGVFLAAPGLADGNGLTFDVSTSLRHDSNPDMATTAIEAETKLVTNLGFRWDRETKHSVFSFAASGSALLSDDGFDAIETPQVSLSYAQETASAAIEISASQVTQDVSFLDFVLGEDPSGAPTISAVNGTGYQQRTQGTVALSFGRDTRVTTRVVLSSSDTNFIDTTDPDHVDSWAASLAATADMALTEVTTLGVTARYGYSQELGSARKTTRGLSMDLNHERPNGNITMSLGTSETDSARRSQLSFGRSFSLPASTFSTRLGLTHTHGGDTSVTGGVDWTQELPNGELSLGASHSVSGDAGDENHSTQINLGLSHAFTPELSTSFGLAFGRIREEATAETTRTTSLTASVDYALQEDWGLSAGVSHRTREETGSAKTDNTSVFLTLSRALTY